MDLFFCILGILCAFASGIFCYMYVTEDDVSLLCCILFFVGSAIFFLGSYDIALKNSKYPIEALNGTLTYDTVSLDKEGKLLEIKIK